MDTALVPVEAQDNLPAGYLAEIELVNEALANSRAASTRRCYAATMRIFEAWCRERGESPLPASPEVVARFASWRAQVAQVSASTLGKDIAAIRAAHTQAGHPSPCDHEGVKLTMKGLRRSLGAAKKPKAPLTSDRLVSLLAQVPANTPQGLRDRAILIIGFGGALRRSELAALRVEDISEVTEGLDITIRHSKTDQEGQGQTISLPREVTAPDFCPCRALKVWLEAAGITSGPVFPRLRRWGRITGEAMTGHSIAATVKRYALAAGLNPADFAGHSLRSGWLTSAAEDGASTFKLQEVSRHKSLDVLAGYVRRADRFKDHAGAGLLAKGARAA